MSDAAPLRVLGVIPARLSSTRLPRKVLREIAGKPLIVHVYEAARRAPDLDDLLVATDSQEVVDACAKYGIPTLMTSPEHPSGTDRIWEVAQTRAADVYVNIQGDEPLITAEHVRLLVGPFRERPDTQVTTLKIQLAPEEISNPNVNKVVCGVGGRALYFSKYPVPYDRDGFGVVRFKHPGFYAYRKAALDAFHHLVPSPLERTEKLEQLRFLENGIDIIVVETTEPTIGVDTEADLQAVAALMAARRQAPR